MAAFWYEAVCLRFDYYVIVAIQLNYNPFRVKDNQPITDTFLLWRISIMTSNSEDISNLHLNFSV